MTRRSLLIAALAAALLLAACGGGDTTDGSDTTQPPTTTTTPPSTTAPPATTTTTPSPAPTTPPTTLPGEPIDIGPRQGDVLAVIGVAHDDVLNVRLGPGTDQPIVTTLDPLADDVVALGNTRSLPQSIWVEVEANGMTGWVSLAFVGYLGQTTDETAAIIDRLGATPEAETMLDLGLRVSGLLASDEPPSLIVMSVAPSVGDLGEVTFDVVGLGDDALRGYRLHLFATPSESQEGFVLKSVEQTILCGRGVSDGLCT